jgi:hypothetical protein
VAVSVIPPHINKVFVMDGDGSALTVIAELGLETHPVLVCVNVNVAVPAPTLETKPALVTVATAELLLAHVPPELGLNVVVAPAHRVDAPLILTVGFALTVTVEETSEAHPVLVCVNVNVAVPDPTPVTTPALDTVATAVLLLAHVPPVVGLKVVVLPTHIVLAPLITTIGFAFTVNGAVASEAHAVLVKV